ncbi:unnamed protein product, partial [Mesorhabditis belari]|uniref:Uncharacterized protein n=1 Tax=Mesorhabditis belari TaxID=2138241 RepID=A0AAF3EZ28_9BILA
MELWRSAPASCSGFDAVFNEIDEDIRRLQRKGSSNTASDVLQENDKAVDKEGEDPNQKSWVDNVGAFSSPASSSANLHEMDPPLHQMASVAQFQRLRELCIAVQESSDQVERFRARIDPEGPLKNDYDRYQDASILQNQELLVELLRRQISELRKRIARRRILIADIVEEKIAREIKMKQLANDVERAKDKASLDDDEILRVGRHCDIMRTLIKKRRREMIDELFRAYKIQVDMLQSPTINGKKPCSCIQVDSIAGVHLPRTESILTHPEPEVAAALGHVVNLMRCVMWVLDTPLPFPLTFVGSRSQVYDARKDKKYSLFGMKSKLERAQLEFAMQLLNANILAFEIHQWIVGNNLRPSLDRPFTSVFSPAALIERRNSEETIADNVRNESTRLLHTLDVSQLCIDDLPPTNAYRERTVTIGEEAVDLDEESPATKSTNSFIDTAIGL